MVDNPLQEWVVDTTKITYVGKDLRRPECVLAEQNGTLWTADARGGVLRIAPNGDQELIVPFSMEEEESASVEQRIFAGTLPNGIAFTPQGDFIIADFGTDTVDFMTRSGEKTTLYSEIDGQPLGKTNFVLGDSRGRTWLTVTTRLEPWTRSINERTPDGYVALIDEHGIRIVADGFVGTNEIRFDANEEWLYVVESNARHISRLRAHPDGTLSDREIYGPGDLGGIPDGFAFDVLGNLWITLVNADRLIALTTAGEILTLLDDGDRNGAAEFDRHFFAGTVTPEVLGGGRGTIAPLMASVTFGGPDLSTVYLGSLMGTSLPSFQSPVPGLALPHWSRLSA
jgi:sugar lactone lactonase YvrE